MLIYFDAKLDFEAAVHSACINETFIWASYGNINVGSWLKALFCHLTILARQNN